MFDVDIYAENSALQRKSTFHAISNYGHYLGRHGENEAIMDIGCGDGWVTVNILNPFLSNNRHKGTLHAVDFNNQCIDRARKNHIMSGITFDVMDFTSEQDTDKYTNSMDKIFSFYSLQWCSDIRICFKNIHKMLKTGGNVFCTFVTGENFINRMFKEQLLSKKWITYYTGAMKEHYLSELYQAENSEKFVQDILEECNFKVSICKLITNDFTFVDFDHLKVYFNAIPGMCDHLPQPLKEEFFEELKIATQDSLTFSTTCLLVIATKK